MKFRIIEKYINHWYIDAYIYDRFNLADGRNYYGILAEELDYIVEGKALGGLPSTIIDLTQEGFKIIREGPIKEKDILEALEER